MIKFHPSREMLNEHLAANLPLSLTVAMSAHIEMCELCKAESKKLEQLQSQLLWQEPDVQPVDFGDMLQNILASPPEKKLQAANKSEVMVAVANRKYQLPAAFRLFTKLKWSGLGAVSRTRLINNENEVRASLLRIDKGGSIPKHQHKGYELTLLLDGSFSDENGTYHKGDFICLQGGAEHAPYTENGCLCYVVQNAPVHFVSGVSKVLNPLASLLY
jgi:putative transcriptional regulator